MRGTGPGVGRGRLRGGGFSLLEIATALPILAFVSLAVVSAIVFASRASRIVANQIAAKNIAQSFFERMAIDEFTSVTLANYPSITLNSSPPLYLDFVRGSKCAVDIVITGYGYADSGTATTLVDNDAAWQPNEWVGNTVFLVHGQGRGQRRRIINNTAHTLVLDSDLSPPPASNTYYLINGGKTVRITTRWRYLGKDYRARIESLVIDWGPRR